MSGNQVSFSGPLTPMQVPSGLALSGAIYEAACTLRGQVWKEDAGGCLSRQIQTPPPPPLINSHFPVGLEHPGGAISFYLKQRQASYLIYRRQGQVAPRLVAKVSFKWKSGWRDITYIVPAIC